MCNSDATAFRTAPKSHRAARLLCSYRFNADRGSAVVRNMILEDIRRFADMGADAYVSDLRDVLSSFEDEASSTSI